MRGNSAQTECLITMHARSFSPQLRRESLIWAAKERRCPRCKSKPGQACLNLTTAKQGIKQATKFPHDERVDWVKLRTALEQRGYR